MATSVSSVVSHFPEAENGFTTTTAGSVSSGATTVTLNSVAGYTNGEPVVLVIDPTDASKKQTFTGIVDTGGVQITSVVWTAGTNQTHALGATVVDYATATHISMISKGIKVHADQDGTLKAGAVDVTAVIADGVITKAKLATAEKSALDSGWSPKYGDTTVPAPNTVTCNGNRSYDVVFNSVDLTGYLSAGMRIRTTRTVAAPTQCADLEASSSHYFSKTSPSGLSFTDEFTCMAWIKLESYTLGGIIARRNADTEGWSMEVQANGTLTMTGLRIAGNNLNIASYQSIPLNKWIHVAATLDMSANTGTVYFDGTLVPSVVGVSGTATAIVQGTTALVVGARKSAGTDPFDGKIAQAAVFSDDLSAATIRSYMSQGLSGSEASLVSAFSLSNSLNDLNANANNLTAQGSAVATATDSPFGGQADGTISSTLDYAIITKTAFSTNTTLTVQVPEGCTIPTSGGVTSLAYSTQKCPYGMPVQKGKWSILWYSKAGGNFGAGATNNTWQSGPTNGSFAITIPLGEWNVDYTFVRYVDRGAAVDLETFASISTSSSSESDTFWTTWTKAGRLAANSLHAAVHSCAGYISTSTATPYYILGKAVSSDSTVSNNGLFGIGANYVNAELAYL